MNCGLKMETNLEQNKGTLKRKDRTANRKWGNRKVLLTFGGQEDVQVRHILHSYTQGFQRQGIAILIIGMGVKN